MSDVTPHARPTGGEHPDLRELLLAEVQRLTGQLDAIHREATRLHADRVGHDSVDDGIAQADADHAGHVADLSQQRLEATTAAIERISAGTYGRCEGCGQPIDPARLQVRPTATTCIACVGSRNPAVASSS